MEKKNRKPAWWQLYLLIPMMALLLGAAQVHPLPGVSKEVTDLLIIVFIFGSMPVWVWANRVALDEEYMDRPLPGADLKITIYEPPSQQEKNRDRSHGVPPLAWPDRTIKIQANTEIEDLEREK